MTDGDSPYIYTPLPGPDFIRILTVHPAPQTHDVITCNVSVEPLDIASYSALSCTWGMNATGDAEKTRTIIVESMRIPVTQNLLEGLQRIRSPPESIRIWINAVCINQIDLAEQGAQVACMDKIYANASPVVDWLGEGETEREDAAILRLFQCMQQHLSSDNKQQMASCLYCSLVNQECDCGCSTIKIRSQETTKVSPTSLDNGNSCGLVPKELDGLG